MNGMGVRPRIALGFCLLLAVIMLSHSSAVARAARWSHHRCDAEYAAYLTRHQHVATGTKQAEQERLNHAHGCRLEASLPGPPLVPLTGIGATEGAWRARHRADVEFPGGGAYDPEPGAFPGSVTNDKYNVTFGRGRVDAYTVKFRPGGNQAAASALVKGELPVDAKLVVSPKPLGKCAAEELESRSLGAAEQGRSVIVVTYESHYDLSEVPYNAGSVVQAFVSLTPGPPSPASRFGEGDLGSLICG